MQRILESRGFVSKAFRFTYPQLIKAVTTYGPVILYFFDDEGHFVLCLHVDEDVAVIADPTSGLSFLSKEDLEQHWQGPALLVQHGSLIQNRDSLQQARSEVLVRREALVGFAIRAFRGVGR